MGELQSSSGLQVHIIASESIGSPVCYCVLIQPSNVLYFSTGLSRCGRNLTAFSITCLPSSGTGLWLIVNLQTLISRFNFLFLFVQLMLFRPGTSQAVLVSYDQMNEFFPPFLIPFGSQGKEKADLTHRHPLQTFGVSCCDECKGLPPLQTPSTEPVLIILCLSFPFVKCKESSCHRL